MQEYTREFTRLLNCVPFAARDEARKVYLDERGSRPKNITLVLAQRLQTLDAPIEQALWVERGATMVSKRATVTGQSGQKAPGLTRCGIDQSQTSAEASMVMFSGSWLLGATMVWWILSAATAVEDSAMIHLWRRHWSRQCEKREDQFFGCGQPEHLRVACPRATSLAHLMASTPPVPEQTFGAPPT